MTRNGGLNEVRCQAAGTHLEKMNLERFKIAQLDSVNGFHVAIGELRGGRKKSHWIWYIFPQLRILGRSPTAQFYGIESLAEAREYLHDRTLADNLASAMGAVLEKFEQGIAIEELMNGYTDSLKLVSCCTLFKYASEEAVALHENPVWKEIKIAADRILEFAGHQGYPECVITRDALQASK